MHPTLCVLVVLEVFTTFTTSLTVPVGQSLSQNAPVGVDVSANSSLASPSFSSAPSTNTGLAVNPEVREYTVFPQQPQKVAQVASAIQAFAVQDSVRTITDKYRPEYDYILYWQLRALPDAAQQLREQLGSDAYLFETTQVAEQAEISSPGSSSQPKVTGGLLPEKFHYVRQRNAPEHLRVVSWPPGKKLANLGGYLYDIDWRIKPTVYIIDSGLDSTSTDFTLGIHKWLYSPNVKAQRKNTPTDDNANSHGSCILSNAIGITNGVYKNVIDSRIRAETSKVVVVKVDSKLPLGEILWAFSAIRTDIMDSPTTQPAVIAYPWTSYHADPVPWLTVKTYFQEIFDLGGTIIVPSGNDAETPGRQADVDTLPAGWESPTFPLIVVGAVDNTGSPAPFSQGPTHVTVWAPGVDVQCAKRGGFRTGSGTSQSAGMVAGLVAYTLALEQVPFVSSIRTAFFVKNWLLNAASWVRQPPRGPRVIWNREPGY